MRIEVTQEDIDAGVPWSCRRCPVARAAGRALPGRRVVMAFRFNMIVGDEEAALSVPVPVEVAKFIDAFDADRPVSPFSFDLNIP